MPKTIMVTAVAPRKLKEGEEFDLEVTLPERVRKPRGQLQGMSLEDMTMEQLKRERINAASVLYKAQKRGANAETIEKNTARLDAVKAELTRRAPIAVEVTEDSEAVEGDAAEAPAEYDEAVAEEI